MCGATAWVMDRMPESLHYTHSYRDGWILAPGIVAYTIVLNLIDGFYWESILLSLPVALIFLAMFFYPRSHIVFDLTGIHVRDRKRKEYAMIPWAAVQHMKYHPGGGKHNPSYALIATIHPIAVEYILEKQMPFLGDPLRKFSADRFMEQVVRGKMSPEVFEKQQLLYFMLPYSCYTKVYSFWKSAQNKLEEDKN